MGKILCGWLVIVACVAGVLAAWGGELPEGTQNSASIESPPGHSKLIKRTYRPPNYESPLDAFDQPFTPNERFFIRSHLSAIPKIDAESWRLVVGGDAARKPLSLSLKDLRGLPQVEIPALAFCSGNRRGLTEPHVPGVQWAIGAMGNAKWRGVRLKDVLARAGVRESAVEVVFDGADTPAFPQTPDFKKSLPLSKALDPSTLIALEMNGQPLPESQGFPARLVVPGWTATYWMKQLVAIELVSKPFDGFWMKSAYRIPKGKFPEVETRWDGQGNEKNTPITEMVVGSLVTHPRPGELLKKGRPFTVRGWAWDGGSGIGRVEVSADDGKTWKTASLERDYGRFSWRGFSLKLLPPRAGTTRILARASNLKGQKQPDRWTENPAGYHNAVPLPVEVKVE